MTPKSRGDMDAGELRHELATAELARDAWKEVAERKGGRDIVKTSQIAAGLLTILIAAGGGWIGFVHSQVAGVQGDQSKEKEKRGDVERKVDVIGEKVQRIERDQQEIKQDVREQNRKLDEIRELLRRGQRP